MFHLYGLFIGFGVLLGYQVSRLQSNRFRISQDALEASLIWIFIPAIIGARLYHIGTDWYLYEAASVWSIIAIWNGGLGYFGALLGGLIGLLLYSLRQKRVLMNQTLPFRFFILLDLFSFGAPLVQAIGRWGNYFNQELYGLPTTLPWGIVINGQIYHPLFAYEVIGTLGIFLFINWLGVSKKFSIGKGQYACVYLTLYGLMRFWLEYLRIDTARAVGLLGFFSIAQWISLAMALTAIAIFWLRRHADRGIEWELNTLL